MPEFIFLGKGKVGFKHCSVLSGPQKVVLADPLSGVLSNIKENLFRLESWPGIFFPHMTKRRRLQTESKLSSLSALVKLSVSGGKKF